MSISLQVCLLFSHCFRPDWPGSHRRLCRGLHWRGGARRCHPHRERADRLRVHFHHQPRRTLPDPVRQSGNLRNHLRGAGLQEAGPRRNPVRSTETARVDVALEIGSVVESVEVKVDCAACSKPRPPLPGIWSPARSSTSCRPRSRRCRASLVYMPGVTSQRGEGHGAGQRSRAFNMSMDGVSGMEPVAAASAPARTLYTAEAEYRRSKGSDYCAARRVRPLRRRRS